MCTDMAMLCITRLLLVDEEEASSLHWNDDTNTPVYALKPVMDKGIGIFNEIINNKFNNRLLCKSIPYR